MEGEAASDRRGARESGCAIVGRQPELLLQQRIGGAQGAVDPGLFVRERLAADVDLGRDRVLQALCDRLVVSPDDPRVVAVASEYISKPFTTQLASVPP